MGHRGQIFTKDATDEQREALEKVLEALELGPEYIEPASERDDQDRRISVSFHVDATERLDADERWDRFGASRAALHRLAWRVGSELVHDAMVELGLIVDAPE